MQSRTSGSATTAYPSIRYGIPIENVTADAGTDLRLSCKDGFSSEPVAWIRKRAKESNLKPTGQTGKQTTWTTNPDGSIQFSKLIPMEDSGIYTCVVPSSNRELRVIKLIVKTVPPAVANLSVHPHSVYALVTWQLPGDGDGGYPILRYVLSYRLDKSHLVFHDVNSSSPRDNRSLDGGTPTYLSMSSAFSISAPIPQKEYEWKGSN